MKNTAPGMEVARRIVTGDFHPSLESALLSHLTGRVEHAPLSPTPVIVPTNLLGLRLSRALAARTEGHANVRFMTLVDFAAAEAPVPLPGNRAVLPRRADEVVVRRLLSEGIARGGYFHSIADRPGLSRAILAAIRDLKEASYDPDALDSAVRTAGLRGRMRRGKFVELAAIWRAYEENLRRGRWADRLDLMREAAAALEQPADPLPPLTVYGFYDLNPLQKRLLGAYIRRADAVVFFPFVDTPCFDYARPTLDWFLSLGLEREDVGGDARFAALPAETLVISAPGEAREAREVTRTLVRILEERDLSFQDVTVVTRSPSVYSDLFAEEFERLGADAYIETPPPLSRTRSGRSLLKLALAVESAFARSDVIEFLSLADIEMPGAPPEAPVSDWNKATVLAGITSGAETWLPALNRLRQRIERARPDDAFAEAHAGLAAPIASLITVLSRVLERLSEVPPEDTVKRHTESLLGALESITRVSDERSLVLSEARKLLGVSDVAGAITFAYFAELLRSRLDAGAPRRQSFGRGGPTVLNVMSARGLRCPVAVVPGLVEREFPLRRRQDPILLDSERVRLNGAHGGDPLRALPVRAAGIGEERLLFHLAAQTAAETLILSFPRLDPATARPRVASAFLLRTLEELTGERQDYEALDRSRRVNRIPLSRRFPATRAEALTREEFHGCSILRAVASGSPEEIAYLVHEAGPLPPRLDMEEERWGKPFFTRYDGVLRSEDALAAAAKLSGYTRQGRPGRAVSATSLEEYATCPFRFFMHHVLGLEPVEEPEEALQLSPPDRGRLYHAVLEDFFRRLKRDGLPVGRESRDILRRISEHHVENGPWNLVGYEGARLLVLQELLSDLAPWLTEEMRDDSGLVPTHFEVRFGGEIGDRDDSDLSTEDTVPFDALGGVRVEFGGRVDRIDVSPPGDRARVIDYKSGRHPGKKKRVLYRGKRLQLPIYLLAARMMLGRRHAGIDVESAQYRYVTERGADTSLVFPRSLLDERLQDLRSAVGLIISEGIGAGMFFPYPEDPGCRNCDYAEACSSAAVPLGAMKNGDPRAEFFISTLAGID